MKPWSVPNFLRYFGSRPSRSLLARAACLMFSATLLCAAGGASAATYFSRATGNWNAAATWSTVACGGVAAAAAPGAADDVQICNLGAAHTVTVTANATIASVTFNGGNQASTLTVNAAVLLTVNGDVTVNAPTAAVIKNINLAANGDLTVNGNLALVGGGAAGQIARLTLGNNAGTTVIVTGNLAGTVAGGAFNARANVTFSGAGTLNIGGNFANGATFARGTGTVVYNGGAAQNVGAAYIYRNLTVNKSGGSTATLTGNITLNTGDLTVTNGTLNLSTFTANRTAAGGVFTIANGAFLRIGGTNTFPTNYTTHTLGATSTVTYDGTNQNVAVEAAPGYGHLTLSGTLTKTALGIFTVRGDLSITGVTFAGTTFTHTVNGNVSNTGTHTVTVSTASITLSGGSAAHMLSGTGTYANLVMNDAFGATLGASPTVSGVLTLTNGVIATGANTLITTADCNTPSVLRPGVGHINGNLQLRFNTGAQSCIYHVGDNAAASYTPVVVSFTNVSAAGSLIGSTTSGDYVDTASPIDALHSLNRYWTLALPGAGALAFTGSYDTAFTYLAADNDSATTVSFYAIARGTACGPPCTWTLQTVSGTPTTTSATATGITASFGVFAIGRRRVAQFAISVPGGSVSTCNAASVTITAQDSSAGTADNYTGTINISTSTGDGDWSLTTGNGTLTNTGGGAAGVADDGLATYAFNTLDLGVVTLSLSNVKVNSDVTVTAVDNADAATSSTSTAIQFRGNVFTIANDTVQVAGRNQTMTVTRNRGSGCSETLAEYAGAKPLKAWYTLDGDHPAGANAPAITGAAPAITTSVPAGNNLTLTFGPGTGVANFTLTTTDVGKYTISLRDDAVGTVDGTSPTITTRPFALVVSGVKKGTTDNPAGTATAGGKFIAAGDSFQATVGAYLWNSAVDVDNDGLPDAGATLAQATANGATPTYKWPVTLSAASPFTPATGSLGTLSNGAYVAGDFGSGAATRTNLSYDEVGSFTLNGVATNFLNSGVALTDRLRFFDSTGAQNVVIGRFFPDHFTLTASSVTAACVGGGFTYMGQPNLGYGFTIEARNLAGARTVNYRSTDYATGSVSMLAENNNDGTPLSTRLPAPAGSWTHTDLSGGKYEFTIATATFSRPASPDGAFDALQLGIAVSDADGPVLESRDMNPSSTGDCTSPPTCTGKAIGSATKIRFGRLRLLNAYGSELLPLRLPVRAEYFNGTTWTLNAADSCTSLLASAFALSGGIAANTSASAVALSAGSGTLTLAKPSPVATGSVDVAANLGAGGSDQSCLASHGGTAANVSWLRGFWAPVANCNSTAAWAQDPSARIRFGAAKAPYIYMRERY